MKKIFFISILICKKLLISSALILNSYSFAENSAVILQYHHVGTHTPPSTSVSSEQFKEHLQWIKSNKFNILSLPTVIDHIKNKKIFTSDKVAVITFDDANRSVCDTAWPILKKHQIPFTLFISTEVMEQNLASQCSWSMLQEMVSSGLMTPGNHSHRHLNMISTQSISNSERWELEMRNEVFLAQTIIKKRLGTSSLLFAYPYGEYNDTLSSLITKLGFVGFGQHSGAIGFQSDLSALPRYPVSAQHANIETLSVKLLSLPFPALIIPIHENPIKLQSSSNSPQMIIQPYETSLLTTTTCFDGKGSKLPLVISDGKIIVKSPTKLSIGRHRYTCTSISPFANRFYWISYQWLIE